MAYRIPQHRQTAYTTTNSQAVRSRPPLSNTSALGQSATAESEEWVVFSPSVDANTIKTPTSGRISRISDLASLRSEDYDEDELEEEEEDGMLEDVEEDEEDDEEDDEDFDEDIDLHGFRDPYHQGPVLLPQHDGMGTFQSNLRSRDSKDQLPEGSPPLARDSFTTSRIQAWRMEQSRILLDEIEKATKGRLGLQLTDKQRREEEMASMGGVGIDELRGRTRSEVDVEEEDHETFWARLRRRLVEDIMGLDDMVLQIIFGEALPGDLDKSSSGTATPVEGDGTGLRRMDTSWEEKLFERLARELGVLASHYTPHVAKAAFSTYISGHKHDRVSRSRSGVTSGVATPLERSRSASGLPRSASESTLDPLSSSRQFQPTLGNDEFSNATHASHWGIEDGPLSSSLLAASSEARVDAEIVREYWEKELNVRMLFSYLKSKISSESTEQPATSQSSRRRPSSSSAGTTRVGSSRISSRYGQQQFLRSQHPLIRPYQNMTPTPTTTNPILPTTSTTASRTRRMSSLASLTSVLGMGLGGLRSGSSCASQSTTKKSSGKAGSKVDGNYWDIGSNVGSGRSSCVGGAVWADV